MFQYYSESEMGDVAREHPGDMVVKVDSSLDTERKLIDRIEAAIKAPYTNDNWDGLREALFDLSWLPEGQGVWLLNYELPKLVDEDLDVYMMILFDVDKLWANYLACDDPDILRICFCDSLKDEVERSRKNQWKWNSML